MIYRIYLGHFIPINEVIEDVPVSSYVIRPAYNFGTNTNFTNLRSIDSDNIYTFQIFSGKNSQIDIIPCAYLIKESLLSYNSSLIQNKNFSINTCDMIENNETQFNSINVQFSVDIMNS